MENKKIGNFGEKIAQNYLKKKGYRILDKNYIFRISGSPQKGEIDIIAKKGEITHFIEVKTLQNSKLKIEPQEKVDFRKKRKLEKTAESWLVKNKIPFDSKWQIDIISVKIDFERKKAKIRHFKNI